MHILQKTRLLFLLLVPLLVLSLSGCTGLIGDFTMATTKNVSMDDSHQRIGQTEGEHGKFFTSPSLKLAVDQALENAGPEATYLTNVRIHHTAFMFWNKMRVEGEAWAPSGALSNADASGSEVYRLEVTETGQQYLVSEDGSDRIEVFAVR
jgi:hypothetical protein